jgi:tetratricopeptide (TPR) repeat protein
LNQLDRRGEALVEALRAREVDPLSQSAEIEIADLRVLSGSLCDAIQDAEKILRLDPSRLDARLRLAKYRMLSFNWESAEAEYRRAAAMAPTDPGPHFDYADLLLTLGRKSEAETALRRGLEATDETAEPAYLSSIAVLRYRLGDFETALDLFGRMIRAMPRHRGGYWWSGVCHWRLGNYEEALRFLDLGAQWADGFYRMGRDYYALGTLFVRGLIFADMRDADRAHETISQMAKFPQTSQRPLGTAAVLFHLGELDEGFEWLRRAVERGGIDLYWIDCYALPQEVRQDPRYAEIMGPTGLPTDGPET